MSKMGFLFFSSETEPPAGYLIMKMLNPVEIEFNRLHFSNEYCNIIDSICIVFICVSENLEKQGVGKERKYISHKKGYADYRVKIPYNEFLNADYSKKMRICLDAISNIALDIRKKIHSFDADKFIDDIGDICKKIVFNQ